MKKIKTKATINKSFETSTPKISKQNINKLKKLSPKNILIAFLIMVISVGVAIGGCYLATRNDCFKIIGNEELTFMVSEKYIDEGCKVIEFGKDKSNKIEIETNLIINPDGSYSPPKDNENNYVVGTYYIVYTADTFKYSTISNIQRIRLIHFIENSEDSLGE